MNRILHLHGTTIEGGCVCSSVISYDGSARLNACNLRLHEEGRGPTMPGPDQGPPKRPKLIKLFPPLYFPARMNVDTLDLSLEKIGEAWSDIAETTENLTEEQTDITLDFRDMLCGDEAMLAAAMPEDTQGNLVAAIVRKCTRVTKVCVKIGTYPLTCQRDDEEYKLGMVQTTNAQWRVIGCIVKLIQTIVEKAKQ